jgi:imidazolonepropionase-like amidohydrolase
LLQGGSVLDVASGGVSTADVVIEGDRIVDVGPSMDGDESVDCAGQLLVPGFIDCHTHIGLTLYLSPMALMVPRSVHLFSVVPVLQTLLERGVTTVRDAAGADAGVQQALVNGWISGPEVLVSLVQLSTTGGIGDAWLPGLGKLDGSTDPALPESVFDGPDQARAAVRRMVRAGADWIKLAASGSMMQGGRAHDVQMTADEMAAVVEEATRHGGRQVMVHAHSARAVEAAARAGAHSIEHGVWLDEDAVAAMVEAGCFLVPTLSITQSDPEGNPPGAAEAHRRSVQMAIDAGVPIAMGSDNPVRPHTEVLREIEHLSAAGLGRKRAFRAATLDAAKLLRVDHDRGELTPGKRADIVALQGNDLEVVGLENRICTVWHNGQQVNRKH